MGKFRRFFRRVQDPRADNARHDLVELLVIALAAVLCGAESCADMADFGQAKEGLLRLFLRLEHGIPSHDTFSRVFRLLDPQGFETAGALEVLELLSLEGCIVTADALHCHRAMAATILDRGGDYVLAIKANRGPLFTTVVRQFARSGKRSVSERREPSTHDRREARRATIMRNSSLAAVHGFPGVVAIGRVTSRRRLHGQRAEPPLVRYYLLSKYMPPTRLLQVTRSHWSIENQLHWVLDVHFDEDGNRARKDNAPENLAILRRLALNILRSHPDRASIRRKIKRAGWDDAFLMAILSHMR